MEARLQWDGCDAVINLGILGRRIFLDRLARSVKTADPSYTTAFLDGAVAGLIEFEKDYIARIVGLMETYAKPVVGVSLLTDEQDATVHQVDGHAFKGVFYETPERAVKALAHMVDYQRYRSRHDGLEKRS